jgi:hypothetical protein
VQSREDAGDGDTVTADINTELGQLTAAIRQSRALLGAGTAASRAELRAWLEVYTVRARGVGGVVVTLVIPCHSSTTPWLTSNVAHAL